MPAEPPSVAALALEHVGVAYAVFDREFRYVFVNRRAEELLGLNRECLLGRSVWEVFPDLAGSNVEREYRRAAENRVPTRFENYYPAWGRWYAIEADPVAGGGIVVAFRDITDSKRNEEDLARSRDLLELIGQSRLFGWFRWHIPEDELQISPEASPMHALASEARTISSAEWRAAIHPAERPEFDKNLARCFERHDSSFSCDFRAATADSSETWIHCQARVTYGPGGEPVSMVGITTDVTDRKRTVRQLEWIRSNLETAQHIANVGSWENDLRRGQLWWSAETYRIFGLPEYQPLTAADFYSAVVPAERAFVRELAERARAGTAEYDVEHRIVRPNGEIRHVHERAHVIRDERGVPVRMIGSVHDITDRKRLEESLRDRIEELETVMDLAPVAIWVARDPECRHIVGNRMANRFYEAEPGENVSATSVGPLRKFFRDGVELAAEELPMQQAVARNADIRDTELQVVLPSGRTISMLGHASPLRDAAGQVRGCVGAFLDITERKNAERQLRESEERLRIALDGAGIGMFDYRPATGEVFWDERAKAHWSVPADAQPKYSEVIGRIHPDDREAAEAAVAAAFEAGTSDDFVLEHRIVWPDGSVHWGIARGRVHRSDDPDPGRALRLVGVHIDITDQKRATAELERVSRIVKLAHEAGKSGAWEWNLETGELTWTEEYFRLFRLEPNFAPTFDRYFSLIHPEDRDRVRDFFDREIRNRAPEFSSEFRVIFPDGIHWIERRGQVICNAEGKPVRMVGISTDITERKRLEQALVESNEDLKRFAYVASHDLQEPLRNLVSFSELLERRNRGLLDADSEEFLSYIVNSAERMSVLIQDLLHYSRVTNDTGAAAPVDLNGALQTALANLSKPIEESRAEIIADQLPTVPGVGTLLVRVFQNLIGNAIKYRRAERAPRIRIMATRRGGEWLFSVSDNGIGFDMQYAEDIFVIFKRLHGRDEYPGSGIGLAIVKRIVERHGGQVCVESMPGHGSSFHFTLPVAYNEQANITPPASVERS